MFRSPGAVVSICLPLKVAPVSRPMSRGERGEKGERVEERREKEAHNLRISAEQRAELSR
jgi:hypothetical protein